jgi:glutaredoxin
MLNCATELRTEVAAAARRGDAVDRAGRNRRRKTLMKAQVRLYTRPGCHLCEEAKAAMLAADCADAYELEEVNIDDDPALKKSYGLKIPVITINGSEAFVYRLDAAEFRQRLREAERA